MSNNVLSPMVIEMLKEVETVLVKYNVKYYLVGAIARDIHLSDYKAKRRTDDVDIAVMLDSEEDFDNIKNDLIKKGTFQPHDTEAIKLFYKNKVELDLLPFGKIENEYSETCLTRPKIFVMDVPGFKDLVPFIQTKNIEGIQLNVCPLEGIIILKLLANDDRPDRLKDIVDIQHFIDVYFSLNSDEIYEQYYDVIAIYEQVSDEAFEKMISSRIIGRKIGNMLSTSPDLSKRIKRILSDSNNMFWKEILIGIEG